MNKEKLEKIAQEVMHCKKCRLWKTRTNAVPGAGPANAKIMFVGEAPGSMEDLSGFPFVGPSGKFLNKMLEIAKIDREKVFISSPLKCRPPKNRKPKPDEIKKCLPYLKKQISVINPKLIVLLGETAIRALLDLKKVELSKLHGKMINKEGRVYFPTFHPAAGRRFPVVRKMMLDDFRTLGNLRVAYLKGKKRTGSSA